jgi:hypothetical protein
MRASASLKRVPELAVLSALRVSKLSWSGNQIDRSAEVGNAIYPTF